MNLQKFSRDGEKKKSSVVYSLLTVRPGMSQSRLLDIPGSMVLVDRSHRGAYRFVGFLSSVLGPSKGNCQRSRKVETLSTVPLGDDIEIDYDRCMRV